jgi:predicted nucleic acid-binding Zn ribbon protein
MTSQSPTPSAINDICKKYREDDLRECNRSIDRIVARIRTECFELLNKEKKNKSILIIIFSVVIPILLIIIFYISYKLYKK